MIKHILVYSLLLVAACGKKDDDGAAPAAAAASTTVPPTTASSAAPEGAKAEATFVGIPITGVSKKDCNSAGNAWVAVKKAPTGADADNREAVCDAPLAAWPCCNAQVLARFPEAVEDGADKQPGLASLLARYGTDGYRMYNCSHAADGQVQLHFLRVAEDGRWLYRRMQFAAAETEPAAGAGACADPGAAAGGAGIDLGVDAVAAGSTPVTTPPASTTPSAPTVPEDTAPKVAFTGEVNPILTVTCGGGACHGQDAFSAAFRYVGGEITFRQAKSKVLDRIARDPGAPGHMPPATSGRTFSDADKEVIVNFLNQ